MCVYHENVKLMFEGCRLKEATAGDEVPLKSFKDCIHELVCEDPQPKCYLRERDSCPSPDALKERLKYLFDENMVESITFRGWYKVEGRYHLEKVIKPAPEFIEIFMKTLDNLIPHHFITKKQSGFYEKKKKNWLMEKFW